jgi:unsaturated rhamnogalacturonyl hydrolase
MHITSLKLGALLLGTALLAYAEDKPAATPDLSGQTDASIREVLRVVARHQIHPLKDGQYPSVDTIDAAKAATQPEGIAWSYPWGVTLYGVLRSTDATGDNEARDFVLEHNKIASRDYAWIESFHQKVGNEAWNAFVKDGKNTKIGPLLRLGNLDSCGAMGVQILEGMLRYPDQATPEEKVVTARIVDWIAEKQDRLPDGTLWREKSADENGAWPKGTIWADDLYMGCPAMVRWSTLTKNGKYLTDAAHQIINMAQRLQDKDGVWFHAYSPIKEQHSPFKWGRANGWITIASIEVLSAMPENHPDRAALLDIFRRHIDGLKKLQAPSGMWRQVLDHPELWEETSCTAMFAYSIARGVNRGWLPPEDMAVARKAFAAICANYITPEGVVKGTCRGTNIGFKIEYYADRDRPDDDLHGRGVVLLAGTEILNPKK